MLLLTLFVCGIGAIPLSRVLLPTGLAPATFTAYAGVCGPSAPVFNTSIVAYPEKLLAPCSVEDLDSLGNQHSTLLFRDNPRCPPEQVAAVAQQKGYEAVLFVTPVTKDLAHQALVLRLKGRNAVDIPIFFTTSRADINGDVTEWIAVDLLPAENMYEGALYRGACGFVCFLLALVTAYKAYICITGLRDEEIESWKKLNTGQLVRVNEILSAVILWVYLVDPNGINVIHSYPIQSFLHGLFSMLGILTLTALLLVYEEALTEIGEAPKIRPKAVKVFFGMFVAVYSLSFTQNLIPVDAVAFPRGIVLIVSLLGSSAYLLMIAIKFVRSKSKVLHVLGDSSNDSETVSKIKKLTKNLTYIGMLLLFMNLLGVVAIVNLLGGGEVVVFMLVAVSAETILGVLQVVSLPHKGTEVEV